MLTRVEGLRAHESVARDEPVRAMRCGDGEVRAEGGDSERERLRERSGRGPPGRRETTPLRSSVAASAATGTATRSPRDGARDFSVRPYRPGDEAGILALFARAFGSHGVRSRRLWEWEYRRCPEGRQIVLAVAADGEVLAHYATVPVRLHVAGSVVLAGHVVDSMGQPRRRGGLGGRGPFLAVARRYFETFGTAALAHCGFGFTTPPIHRFGARHLHYSAVVPELPALFCNLFAGAPPALHVPATVALREVERFDPAVDRLWARCAPEMPLTIVRDRRYLDWRYADIPVPYRRFEVWRGERLDALFVLRAGWCGAPIVALTELLARRDDLQALECALATALHLAGELGMTRVETWLPERHPFFARARALGFRSERTNLTLTARLYRTPEALDWHRENWFYTIGDSDIF